MKTDIGYQEARKAIMERRAVPHALWILLSNESDRDGYALKPNPWEGSGEYQHIEIDGEYGRLIRIPLCAPSLINLAKKVNA